ncbi:hypothetical protein ACWGLF_19925 [Streptomyces puniciscabiei]
MTAGGGNAGEYGGMDALMAAITGEPVPEEARRDPAFLAEHRAAEADLAVLREQLGRLAEALTGEEAAPEPQERAGHPAPVSRPRGAVRPVRAGHRPPRPGRPAGPRRVLRIAFGALAGAAAFALVAGFGWLITHSGASDDSAASASGKAVAEAPDGVSGEGGRPSDAALTLACSRLVVEGTVTGVEPQKSSPWSRVTLKVIRSYKPAHGPAEVTFLLDGGVKPAPRKGRHVLVQVGAGQPDASLWAVGDARVAADRAWIEKALPGSRHVTCPAEEAPTERP